MEQKLYSDKAMEQVKSPEELDKYIKVTKPGVFMVLGMVLVLIGTFTYWLVFGSLSTYMEVPGAAYNGQVICFVPIADKDQVKVGQKVNIHVDKKVTAAEVTKVGDRAVDRQQLDLELPKGWEEYLEFKDWNVGVGIDTALADYTLCQVYIVVDTVRPYELMMK